MTRPINNTFPRWATDLTNVIEPSEAQKNTGWVFGEIPPSNVENWIDVTTYNWVKYFDTNNGFSPKESSIPDLSITANSGNLQLQDGSVLQVPEQTSLEATTAITNPKIVRWYIDKEDGSISLLQGSESVSPVPPQTPADKYIIAQVTLSPGQTQIFNQNILDLRPHFSSVYDTRMYKNFLDGLEYSTQNFLTSNIVNIAPGICRDSTNAVTMEIKNPVSKFAQFILSTGWQEDNGIVPTNAVPAGLYPGIDSSYYHTFVISKSDGTSAIGIDYNVNAQNLLADPTVIALGYKFYRRINSFFIEFNVGVFPGLYQKGNDFIYAYARQEINDFDDREDGFTYDMRYIPRGIDFKSFHQFYMRCEPNEDVEIPCYVNPIHFPDYDPVGGPGSPNGGWRTNFMQVGSNIPGSGGIVDLYWSTNLNTNNTTRTRYLVKGLQIQMTTYLTIGYFDERKVS